MSSSLDSLRRPPSLSLRVKATLIVLALLSVALLGAAIGSIASMRTQSVENHGRATASAARGLAIAARVALFSGDREELDRLGRDMLADPDIAFVVLADPAGRVVSQTVADPEGWDLVQREAGISSLLISAM